MKKEIKKSSYTVLKEIHSTAVCDNVLIVELENELKRIDRSIKMEVKKVPCGSVKWVIGLTSVCDKN